MKKIRGRAARRAAEQEAAAKPRRGRPRRAAAEEATAPVAVATPYQVGHLAYLQSELENRKYKNKPEVLARLKERIRATKIKIKEGKLDPS